MTVSFFLQSRELLRQLQKTCLLTPSPLLPAPMSASLVSAAQVWHPVMLTGEPGHSFSS